MEPHLQKSKAVKSSVRCLSSKRRPRWSAEGNRTGHGHINKLRSPYLPLQGMPWIRRKILQGHEPYFCRQGYEASRRKLLMRTPISKPKKNSNKTLITRPWTEFRSPAKDSADCSITSADWRLSRSMRKSHAPPSADVGESEISPGVPISKLLVIQSKQGQQGRMKIMNVNWILLSVVSVLVG